MWASLLNLNLSYSSFILYSIHSFSSYIYISISSIGGRLMDHNLSHVTDNDRVYVGDTWAMEVDLRSEEKEERTLHFFVRGKQQKGYIKGIPDRVEFGV